MGELPERWWRDPVLLQQEVAKHDGNRTECARAHGIAPSTLANAWQQLGLPSLGSGGVKAKPNATTAETHDLTCDQLGDVDQMLRDRGLDPAEWVVASATVNEWTGYDGRLLRQLKVTVRRSLAGALLRPVDLKPVKVPKGRPRPVRAAETFFVYGDDQRPNVDRGFEQAKLQWVQRHQPDHIIDLGDGMDFPTVSGHKTNPAMRWSVQDCANDYAQWLYRLRCAAPGASIDILADNHITGRLRDYQLANAAALYGVKPADIPGTEADIEPLWSVPRLLRLDELGVTYLAPQGDTHYAESHYEIVPGELTALHGYRTGANLGKKFIDDYGCSVIYGHAHGQDLYVTDQRRRGVGDRRRLYAIGVGCGANVQGGGGFAPGADWQNCALTVSVFPDGGWTFDFFNYENGVGRWRDEEYRADVLEVAA